MAIVSELKKLHKVMTGVDAAGDRISEVIESLAENTEPEESGLETVLELTLSATSAGDIPPGFNGWEGELTSEQAAALEAASGTLYFNSESYPLTPLGESDLNVLAYNVVMDQELPEVDDDSLPAYVFAAYENEGSMTWNVLSKESDDLSGQTVRILAGTTAGD